MADTAGGKSRGLIELAALALVAYLIYRTWKAHAPADDVTTPKGTAPPPLPTDAQDLAYDCGSDPLFFEDDITVDNRGAWFYRQVIRPAGRARPFQDVPPSYYALAFRLLSLGLTRDDPSSHRFVNFQKYIDDMKTGRAIDQIIGAVVTAVLSITGFGYLGALYAAVVAQQVKDMSEGIANAESTEAAFQNLKLTAKADKLPPAQLAFMETPAKGDYPQGVLGPVASVPIEAIWRSQYEDGTGVHLLPSTPWTGEDGKKYDFPDRWLTLSPIGFLMPWNSLELKGTTLHDTCNILGRVFRALETIRVLMFPIEPGGDFSNRNLVADEGKGTTYWYHNKVLGDLKGSYLPPTSEDSPYIDSSGQWWTYNGRKRPSDQQIKQGVSHDIPLQADPSKQVFNNTIGLTPDPDDPNTSSGDGGEFAPHNVPKPNEALTKPLPPEPAAPAQQVFTAPPPPPPVPSPAPARQVLTIPPPPPPPPPPPSSMGVFHL